MTPPAFGRAGCVARFAFRAWWSPGQDKTGAPRVIIDPDLWEALLRGGKVRRRSFRAIMRVLSELALAGHDPSEVFAPKTCVLAQALRVKPECVARALDDAVEVGLFELVEPRRSGRPASYKLSRRGAARWPTPRFPAG